MAVRSMTALVVVLLLSACGGPAATQPAPGTRTPTGATATPAGATATPAGPVGGESIDHTGIASALAALQSLDSWAFAETYWIERTEGQEEFGVRGEENRKPVAAVHGEHPQEDGTIFEYFRIGDDIWYDLGTGNFTQIKASEAKNLIAQYEPFYITALAASVTAYTNVEYEPVGEETVSEIPAMHYRATQSDLENIVQLTNLQPAQWGADVWIAKDGAYLVRLAWGPQSSDTAQAIMGFNYYLLEVNCDCPIEPPA
jgi:hypothetical protein